MDVKKINSMDPTKYSSYTAEAVGTDYAGTGLDPDGGGGAKGRNGDNDPTNTIACSSEYGPIEIDTVKTRGGNPSWATK